MPLNDVLFTIRAVNATDAAWRGVQQNLDQTINAFGAMGEASTEFGAQFLDTFTQVRRGAHVTQDEIESGFLNALGGMRDLLTTFDETLEGWFEQSRALGTVSDFAEKARDRYELLFEVLRGERSQAELTEEEADEYKYLAGSIELATQSAVRSQLVNRNVTRQLDRTREAQEAYLEKLARQIPMQRQVTHAFEQSTLGAQHLRDRTERLAAATARARETWDSSVEGAALYDSQMQRNIRTMGRLRKEHDETAEGIIESRARIGRQVFFSDVTRDQLEETVGGMARLERHQRRVTEANIRQRNAFERTDDGMALLDESTFRHVKALETARAELRRNTDTQELFRDAIRDTVEVTDELRDEVDATDDGYERLQRRIQRQIHLGSQERENFETTALGTDLLTRSLERNIQTSSRIRNAWDATAEGGEHLQLRVERMGLAQARFRDQLIQTDEGLAQQRRHIGATTTIQQDALAAYRETEDGIKNANAERARAIEFTRKHVDALDSTEEGHQREVGRILRNMEAQREANQQVSTGTKNLRTFLASLQALGAFRGAGFAIEQITHDFEAANNIMGKLRAGIPLVAGSLSKLAEEIKQGFTRGIRAAITDSYEYETALVKLETQIGITREEALAYKDAVREVAVETGRVARNLADSLFFIRSAGQEGAAANEILEQTAKAAAIGLGSERDIARLLTASLNAYGEETLSAHRATEVLLSTVREGALDASELSASVGAALAPAAELGVEFDELGAIIAFYTRVGLTASEATTAFRSVLEGILKPSDQAREILASLGISIQEMQDAVAQDGLIPTLQALRAELGNDITTLTGFLGRQEAVGLVLALTGEQAGDAREVLSSLRQDTDLLDAAFERASSTTEFKLNVAMAELRDVGLRVGSFALPAVNAALGAFVGLLRGSEDDRKRYLSDVRAIIEHLSVTGDLTNRYNVERGILAILNDEAEIGIANQAELLDNARLLTAFVGTPRTHISDTVRSGLVQQARDFGRVDEILDNFQDRLPGGRLWLDAVRENQSNLIFDYGNLIRTQIDVLESEIDDYSGRNSDGAFDRQIQARRDSILELRELYLNLLREDYGTANLQDEEGTGGILYFLRLLGVELRTRLPQDIENYQAALADLGLTQEEINLITQRRIDLMRLEEIQSAGTTDAMLENIEQYDQGIVGLGGTLDQAKQDAENLQDALATAVNVGIEWLALQQGIQATTLREYEDFWSDAQRASARAIEDQMDALNRIERDSLRALDGFEGERRRVLELELRRRFDAEKDALDRTRKEQSRFYEDQQEAAQDVQDRLRDINDAGGQLPLTLAAVDGTLYEDITIRTTEMVELARTTAQSVIDLNETELAWHLGITLDTSEAVGTPEQEDAAKTALDAVVSHLEALGIYIDPSILTTLEPVANIALTGKEGADSKEAFDLVLENVVDHLERLGIFIDPTVLTTINPEGRETLTAEEGSLADTEFEKTRKAMADWMQNTALANPIDVMIGFGLTPVPLTSSTSTSSPEEQRAAIGNWLAGNGEANPVHLMGALGFGSGFNLTSGRRDGPVEVVVVNRQAPSNNVSGVVLGETSTDQQARVDGDTGAHITRDNRLRYRGPTGGNEGVEGF